MARKIGALIAKTIKKSKLGGEVFAPTYATGIDIMDYRGGRWEGNEKVLGVSGGKILYICGRSGSGKSTYAYKIAGNILKSNEDASVIHLDFERAANKARVSAMAEIPISEINSESDTWCYLNSDISSETVYQLVKAVDQQKKDLGDEIKVTKEYNGNKVSYYPPTVIIIDSLATMIPSQYQDEKELSGQMSSSATARQNNTVFKRLINHITDTNIMIIVINHITDSISLGTPTKPKYPFLKQGEDLPGGSSAVFLADSQIKLEGGPKLEPDKDYGIKGFKVIGTYLKSRSNVAGYKSVMIFDQEYGLDNLLSNVEFLKENKLLLGSGHGYFVETMPDKKFKLKTVKEMYNTDKEFREGFDDYINSIYEALLSQPGKEPESGVFEIEDIEDEEKGILKGNDGFFYILENEKYLEVTKNDETGEWEYVE